MQQFTTPSRSLYGLRMTHSKQAALLDTIDMELNKPVDAVHRR
jgi:hypothetical protein